jgi:hypothetical protein
VDDVGRLGRIIGDLTRRHHRRHRPLVKKLTETDYMAFMLRMWRDGEGSPWRASLENTATGESKAFAEIQMLTGFIEYLTGEAPMDGPPGTRPSNKRQRG